MTDNSAVLLGRTPKHIPGFARRLRAAIEYAGIRDYGKLTLISNMTGMSPTGVKLLFSEDRPPAERVKFNDLVSGLVKQIKDCKGKDVLDAQLSDHLLYNAVFPMSGTEGRALGTTKSMLGAYDLAHLGRVYILVAKVSEECGVDIFQELSPGCLDSILHRVLKLFSDSKVKLNDPETYALVKSMIQLGVKGLL